jgi:HEAT repeat protein
MLSPEDIKAEKHFLLGALIIGLLLLAINYTTGFFTRMHLANEEVIALEHGVDSPLYKQMVDELIDDLHSKTDWKRRIAAVELGHLGAGANRAISDLEHLLSDAQPGVRTSAALALARIGSYTGRMVEPLSVLLQEGSQHERYLAVKALGLIGPAAQKAVPALQAQLQTDQPELVAAVREALERITATGE